MIKLEPHPYSFETSDPPRKTEWGNFVSNNEGRIWWYHNRTSFFHGILLAHKKYCFYQGFALGAQSVPESKTNFPTEYVGSVEFSRYYAIDKKFMRFTDI